MKKHTEEMVPLIKIGKVTIYANRMGSYIWFRSDCDVCTDGTGKHFGDKTAQDETAYWNGGKFLNASKDQYIVIPPQVRSLVAPVVMGCMARMTRVSTGEMEPAVCGEIGPSDKTGEAAICLCKKLNPTLSANVGDSALDYIYELWPGVPAVVHGKHYDLEPA